MPRALTKASAERIARDMLKLPPPARATVLDGRLEAEQIAILQMLPERERLETLDALEAVAPRSAVELRERLDARVEIPPELIDQILRGACLLFLGAGVSAEAGLPKSGQLCTALGEPDRPLPMAAQRFVDRRGRLALYKVLQKEFHDAGHFLQADHSSYPFIVNIPYLNSFIFTTNYDSLLEDAFDDENVEAAVIWRGSDLAQLNGSEHAIVKLHGDLKNPDSMVITTSDYETLLDDLQKPGGFGALLGAHLSTRTFIFVGFSMSDEDVNLIQKFIATRSVDAAGRRNQIKHYVVAPWNPGQGQVLENQAGVQVIYARARDFFAEVYKKTSEFLNRTSELNFVCEQCKKPFVEIVGDAGAGKSTLLKSIGRHYRLKKNYSRVVHADFQPGDTPDLWMERLAGDYALDLGDPGLSERDRTVRLVENFRDRSVLLTIDGVDRSPSMIPWLEKELLPAFKALWNNGNGSGRVILATRVPIAWSYLMKVRLERLVLTPFTPDVVEDMVGRYHTLFRGTIADIRDRRQIAEAILDLTGSGHPGMIKAILEQVTSPGNSTRYKTPVDMVAGIKQDRVGLMESRLLPFIDKTLCNLDPEARTLLDNFLCVLRRLNAALLRSAAGCVLSGSPYGVDEALLQDADGLVRHLVESCVAKEPDVARPLYELDPTVGFLLAGLLRAQNHEQYAYAHEVALSAYELGIQRTQDAYQMWYAREALYQLQCLRDIGRRADSLADKARAYRSQMRNAEDPNAVSTQWHDLICEDVGLHKKLLDEGKRLHPDRDPDEWLAERLEELAA